ncbi:MAG: HAD-IIIA family hydrolase [Bacteroidota bacterium]
MHIPKLEIDKSWTLFLDRDGVLNRQLSGAYVRTPQELELLPGVTEAMAFFNGAFGHIVIATNQQGIGKGLMTEKDLHLVHFHLWKQIVEKGGRIDDFYFCPGLERDDPPCRKPNTGMAHEAKRDFPEIVFEKSIMVGDKVTDMEFGKAVDMTTVYLAETPIERADIDYHFISLQAFASFLRD